MTAAWGGGARETLTLSPGAGCDEEPRMVVRDRSGLRRSEFMILCDRRGSARHRLRSPEAALSWWLGSLTGPMS